MENTIFLTRLVKLYNTVMRDGKRAGGCFTPMAPPTPPKPNLQQTPAAGIKIDRKMVVVGL